MNQSGYTISILSRSKSKVVDIGDLPGDPVVKTTPSNAGLAGLIPGQATKISCASRPKIIKQKQYLTNSIKALK